MMISGTFLSSKIETPRPDGEEVEREHEEEGKKRRKRGTGNISVYALERRCCFVKYLSPVICTAKYETHRNYHHSTA